MNTGKTIYVYFDHRSARQAPVLLGTLTAQQVRGKEVFLFEFSMSGDSRKSLPK